MRYNFTDRVRLALAQAREEASRLRHDYVGTEHLLLGLSTEESGEGLLRELGLDVEDLRSHVFGSVRPGKGTVAMGQLPYTSRAKKVLELAMGAARELGDAYVGSEHLLLGLAREGKGIAAQSLEGMGVTADTVLGQVRGTRGGKGGGTRPAVGPDREAAGRARSATSPPEGVWFLEIDPEADAPIYEQIIARIEEAVATGKLETGERLPPVRQLSEELGVAPGTVARAYSELEKRGVLETEGARGTRVASRASSAAAEEERASTLEGLLRPVVVAAYHLGATAEQLRKALERAMKGIFGLLW